MSKIFNFESYINCIVKIIPINIAAFAAMMLYRIFFFFYFKNLSSFDGLYLSILKSFILGMRFDLAIIAYINILVIFIFTAFLLIKNMKAFKTIVSFIKVYYCIAFIAILFITAIDFGFYVCFGEHINILIFDFFKDDTFALIKTILFDWRFYIVLPILVFLSFIVYKISSLTSKKVLNTHNFIDSSSWNIFVKILIVILVPLLTFLFARGTVSMFPLGKFHAQISYNTFINNVALTATHSFTDAIQAKFEQNSDKIDIAQKVGIDKDSIDFSIFIKISNKNLEAEELKPNVVIIVMESFGELPILYNSQDFNVLGELKKHFDEDTVLYNFLAAGVITIHSIESIVLNMPQRPFSLQVTQSPKAYKQFESSLALPYKRAGYVTKAVYGGSLAWRGIDNFFKAQGFDEVYGEGSIENEERHEWGINDAQFFEIILRELKNTKIPKLIYGLSTGTHAPYKTPSYYKPLKLEIPTELRKILIDEKHAQKLFETYQFANREIANFLDAIKNSELKENTIVVVTGDHNLREFKPFSPEDLLKKYAVPMYLYVPDKLKKKINTNLAACHMDIMPTLYDLSLSKKEYVAAGTSLLNEKAKHIAFNSNGFILSDNKAVSYNIETGEIVYFNFDINSKKLYRTNETTEHKKMLEYYKQIMATSDLYINQKSEFIK